MSQDRLHFRNGRLVERPAMAVPVSSGGSAVRAAVELAGDRCIRLFVAGAVTHVGKTTVCLSILAALRDAGFSAAELAYVKPATQCEAPDLLKLWCDEEGIEYVSGEGAPLVFYSGFTRSFLNGEQGTSADWLGRISAKVTEMAQRRRVLIVDGVGFPAVGSIVGVDNADVARAARAPVLLVCKSGVGGAVDSFNLNAAYFSAKGVPVLGALFNLGADSGFYSSDKCAEAIKQWFDVAAGGGRRERYYGLVPIAQDLDGLRERIAQTDRSKVRELARLNASHFAAHVDLPGLLRDAALDVWCRGGAPPAKKPRLGEAPPPAATAAVGAAAGAGTFVPKSRLDVAGIALKLGAKGGG